MRDAALRSIAAGQEWFERDAHLNRRVLQCCDKAIVICRRDSGPTQWLRASFIGRLGATGGTIVGITAGTHKVGELHTVCTCTFRSTTFRGNRLWGLLQKVQAGCTLLSAAAPPKDCMYTQACETLKPYIMQQYEPSWWRRRL